MGYTVVVYRVYSGCLWGIQWLVMGYTVVGYGGIQ